MNDIESRLADGMRRLTGESGFGLRRKPPTQALLARGRKTRRRRRVTWAVGACVVAVGLVGVPLMMGENRQTPQPDSAKIRLVAALSGSDNISYRLKVTNSHRDDTGRPFVFEGAFDPVTRTGRLYSPPDSAGGSYDQRLVEGTLYISHRDSPFQILRGTHDRLQYSGVFGGGLTGTADPQDLLHTLAAANATVTQTGPAGYHFEVDVINDPSSGIHSDRLRGDLTINGDNRIEKVTYERTAQTTVNCLPVTLKEANTLELSGYGEPVTVERPANAVPGGLAPDQTTYQGLPVIRTGRC